MKKNDSLLIRPRHGMGFPRDVPRETHAMPRSDEKSITPSHQQQELSWDLQWRGNPAAVILAPLKHLSSV